VVDVAGGARRELGRGCAGVGVALSESSLTCLKKTLASWRLGVRLRLDPAIRRRISDFDVRPEETDSR